MNYGRKTPSTYRSTTTIGGSTSKRSRSMKSVAIPWYQKPILRNTDIQKAALFTGLFSLFVSIFTIATAVFDLYCLAMASPGSTHRGYYLISYEFVYVGNVHVRNTLIVFALFSLVGACFLFVTSLMLIIALRKEHEKKIMPWLYVFAGFIVFRFFALLFFSILNDLIFAYNIFITVVWVLIIPASVYGWLTVYSLYVELADLTKLEDLAHLRMGTMQSLNASTTHSLAGSRPVTPHTTSVSTMPMDTRIF
ncbi:uncharacterized protein LOC134834666 [Culicoides brevitarsis]|uniref:uncharacterized protein LOC134834666 n=1 Tax=Culicoides brevitarsis TaxID=469753 RepID=UPI00307CB5EF